VSATQRIQHLLDPAYASDLSALGLHDLREMRAECNAVETAVSYTRRLAQGRFEILSAEQARREAGGSAAGSLSELVADLPRILGEERGRSSAANARLVETAEPKIEIDWGPQSHLIADDSLATLDGIGDDDLAKTVAALGDFERELSGYRHSLHGVLATLEREIAGRAADDVN
jgi:hypothetical protein